MLAEKQRLEIVSLQSKRGNIYDREGRQLAISVKSYSLYGDPSIIKKPEIISRSLSPIINIADNDISQKLQSNKKFVWLKRQLSDDTVNRIKSLNLSGLGFREEEKRYYPQGSLASHVIGFVGLDNIGLEGVEKKYDAYICNKTDELIVTRDRKGRNLNPHNISCKQPEPGYDITLTIDIAIQSIVENELLSACKKHHAVGGSVIVMNPKTGEILALANYPTYDLNEAFIATDDVKRNRALIDLYNSDSIFGIITASALINEDKSSLNNDTDHEESIYKKVNIYPINNVRKNTNLAFDDVFDEFNNTKNIKLTEKLGKKRLYEYIKAYGFGEKSGIDMMETVGHIKSPSDWTNYSADSIAFGQEVSVTALQMLSVINVIANDGIMMKPFIVKKITNGDEIAKDIAPCKFRNPISANTANIIKQAFVKVVESGTEKVAKMDFYFVAGKAGTSQKMSEDGTSYISGKYVSSFVGFLPIDDPLISMIVIIDEPKGEYHGEKVACPVFKNIAEQVMQYFTVGQGICIANLKPTS
jgi:cell division protein FtsI (penicillin-binding protein 3)